MKYLLIEKRLTSSFLIVAFVYLVIIATVFSDLKYLKYISPLLFFIFLFMVQKNTIRVDKILRPFIILVFYGLVTLLFNLNQQGLYEIYFILSSWILFLIKPKNIKFNFTYINIFTILIFLIELSLSGKSLILNLSLSSLLYSDTSNLESGISFIFALFALVSFINKRYILLLFNILMLIVTFKRIVFLGLLISILYILMPIYIKKIKLEYIMLFTNIGYLILSFLLVSGEFSSLIHDSFGVGIGQLTQGRLSIYDPIIVYVKNNFFEVLLFGIAPGGTQEIIVESLGYIQLIHNDILKLFVEYGGVIFIIFFYWLYKCAYNVNLKALTILLNVFMLTDNILIYTHVMVIFFLLWFMLYKNVDYKIKI